MDLLPGGRDMEHEMERGFQNIEHRRISGTLYPCVAYFEG
jgi:hypothetical protein